ncbi:MAG TPA: NAD(P)-dependent oxidoreductase [Syntrophobacteria bacterium]|nr:NAD(P)-dependent oxidoreductase [Syntrophobacteria bacterium]
MAKLEEIEPVRILNAEPDGYCEEARKLLRGLGTLVETEVSRAELLAALTKYDVLIVRLRHQIDREVLAAGERLKVIVTATTGLDHIDIEGAKARGVAVLSLHGEHDFLGSIRATAEHTWGLLLCLVRRLVPASLAARLGEWNRDAFRGHELSGKRLGIVGLGRIGRMIAGYGQAFGMDVGAYDPFVGEWRDGVWRAATLSKLLVRSDVLSLHVPLNAETHGMIGPPELGLLPPGAVLLNTSRGPLINEAALVDALESGHLAGAAVDVIADERDADQRMNSPLFAHARAHDNLLVTPHIGGVTYESMAKTEVFMARKLGKFLASQEAVKGAR